MDTYAGQATDAPDRSIFCCSVHNTFAEECQWLWNDLLVRSIIIVMIKVVLVAWIYPYIIIKRKLPSSRLGGADFEYTGTGSVAAARSHGDLLHSAASLQVTLRVGGHHLTKVVLACNGNMKP